MNFERYVIIGGSWNGESILLPANGRGNGYIKLVEKGRPDLMLAGPETSVEPTFDNEEQYIPWDITFVDTGGSEHQWRLLRYKELSEEEALDMLINNYKPEEI